MKKFHNPILLVVLLSLTFFFAACGPPELGIPTSPHPMPIDKPALNGKFIDIPQPKKESIDVLPKENILEYYILNDIDITSQLSNFVESEISDRTDPVVDVMSSWYAYTTKAENEAKKLKNARTAWNAAIKIGQFGGTGAAVVGSGSEKVDNWIGVVGGTVSIIVTIADATAISTNMLRRHIYCDDLASDQPVLNRWISDYLLGKYENNQQKMDKAQSEFQVWMVLVIKKYKGCFTTAVPSS